MHPIIDLFGYSIRVYSITAILAALVGLLGAVLALKRLRYSAKEMAIMGGSLGLSFFIGARGFNYLINRQAFLENQMPLTQVSFSGFSLYGGILLSLVALVISHWFLKRSYWQLLDHLYVPFSLSFIMARLGCLMNGCCYGHYTDSLFGIPLPEKRQLVLSIIIGKNAADALRVHPTQLYEILGTLVVLLLIYVLRRYLVQEGLKALAFGIGFTGVRFLVFFFRELPYSDWVLKWGYPGLYLMLLLFGLSLFLKRKHL